MKLYKRLPGVVLLTIEGEHLLVATKGAREKCPYVTQINDSAADYWSILEEGGTFPDISKRACNRFGKDKKEIFLPLLMFINKMKQSGYLIEEDA